MAHKTLINGTAYSVTGGRELIGGTGYDCKAGKTLIGGTAFAVKFSDGLTWIINKSPRLMNLEQAINFTSNGRPFDYFMIFAESRRGIMYSYKAGDIWTAYSNGRWTQEAFRTVTFAEMPTGALLAWLQANAVQQ